jgi:hypothetical protein
VRRLNLSILPPTGLETYIAKPSSDETVMITLCGRVQYEGSTLCMSRGSVEARYLIFLRYSAINFSALPFNPSTGNKTVTIASSFGLYAIGEQQGARDSSERYIAKSVVGAT